MAKDAPFVVLVRDVPNEAEQENILKAVVWARGRRGLAPADLLNNGFATSLHKRMFGDVWKWAGTYRHTERNIGIEKYFSFIVIKSPFIKTHYPIERLFPTNP